MDRQQPVPRGLPSARLHRGLLARGIRLRTYALSRRHRALPRDPRQHHGPGPGALGAEVPDPQSGRARR